jgi:hypothetical protein
VIPLAAMPAAAAAGAAALRRSTRRSKAVEHRTRTVRALRSLRDVAAAQGAAPYAADALVDVLHLRSCRWAPGPAGIGGAPVLDESGRMDGRIQQRDRSGLLLPEVTHLAAGGGHFVLVPHPERSVTLEERLVATSIAALVRDRR